MLFGGLRGDLSRLAYCPPFLHLIRRKSRCGSQVSVPVLLPIGIWEVSLSQALGRVLGIVEDPEIDSTEQRRTHSVKYSAREDSLEWRRLISPGKSSLNKWRWSWDLKLGWHLTTRERKEVCFSQANNMHLDSEAQGASMKTWRRPRGWSPM